MEDNRSGAGQKTNQNDWMTTTMPVIAFVILMATVNDQERWLVGLVVVGFLFLGNHYISRRQSRIDEVLRQYIKVCQETSGTDQSYHGLEKLRAAGATQLRNRSEMGEVCRRIVAHQYQHPNWAQDQLSNRKMLAFLKYCEKNNQSIQTAANASFAIMLFNKELPSD